MQFDEDHNAYIFSILGNKIISEKICLWSLQYLQFLETFYTIFLLLLRFLSMRVYFNTIV